MLGPDGGDAQRLRDLAPYLLEDERSRKFCGRGELTADEHFEEAIRLHRAAGTALELAKTELLYGNRLRRGRKPKVARGHLRDALLIFSPTRLITGWPAPAPSCARRETPPASRAARPR